MSVGRVVCAITLAAAIGAGPATVFAAVPLDSALDASTPASSGDYVPPATTTVTPYVAGRTLTWTAFNQPANDGAFAPADAVALTGVGSGPTGIIETGSDLAAGKAASWSSSDGGVSWTEHVVPTGASTFGGLAAHGGVFVTHERAFWSSTDGVSWTTAATGPHALQWAVIAAGAQGFVAFVRNGSSTITRVWLSRTGTSGSWVAAPVQGVVSQFCPFGITVTSSRIIAIGNGCSYRSRARVLVSTTGRTWVAGTVPSGLSTTGTPPLTPSISFVSGRYLVTGSNASHSATWIWSSTNGTAWHHVSSLPRFGGDQPDRIATIARLGPGWLAIGDRQIYNDVVALVAWRSSDLVHWSRVTPAVASCPGGGVYQISQAVLARDRLVAVGLGGNLSEHRCGQTWMARVTP